MNKKSGEETKFLSHFSKTDFRYWNEAVFRKGYTKAGRQLFTKEWYARIQHDGRRDFFPLQTANRAAAASMSAVDSKPASRGRIKTSHFFLLNRLELFWQGVI
jgi:hypothetical protein